MNKMFFVIFCLFGTWAQAQTVGMVAEFVMNPVGNFKGKANDVKGEAQIKGDEVTAKNISVDLTKLTTEREMRDKHAKDYLEVTKYPEAVLVEGKGKGGKGTGTLRLHGVEKPISGTYEIKGNFVIAKFTIKLSDFKIEGINYKGVGVEDEVKIEFTVKAVPAPAVKPAAAPAKK